MPGEYADPHAGADVDTAMAGQRNIGRDSGDQFTTEVHQLIRIDKLFDEQYKFIAAQSRHGV